MKIGPNSVVQTFHALTELEGAATRREVEQAVDLPRVTLDHMIPEAWFVTLVDGLRRHLPFERAEAVLARAGSLTADYVRARRIPRVFRGLLAVLPPRLAVPLLLEGFRRHAWTFAGSGAYAVEASRPRVITLSGSPTCRTTNAHEHCEGERGGAYYSAAFEGLLEIASPGVRVEEIECTRQGASACRFLVRTRSDLGPEKTPS